MNKKKFILLALLLLCAYFYELFGGMPATVPFAPQPVKADTSLLLAPLDSRPPCSAMVRKLGALASINVITPPQELLDNYNTPADKEKLFAWLNPEKYASTISFQTVQGLYAIGSGGFFGKGLGNGVQKTVIPEVQNDMILSAICEELGVFGAIIILVLFGLLIYRLLFIAQNAPDLYGALIMTGIMSHIAIQVILNVMVVTNMMPNTGITLPFISYGGTSILFLMIEMGMALGISRRIKLEG